VVISANCPSGYLIFGSGRNCRLLLLGAVIAFLMGLGAPGRLFFDFFGGEAARGRSFFFVLVAGAARAIIFLCSGGQVQF
jgi:hypothetical protein